MVYRMWGINEGFQAERLVEIFFNLSGKHRVVGGKDKFIMAGTKAGGQKAAQKNLERDPNFYAKIGSKGGKNGHTGGFAANPDLARIAGAKGGRISRRKKTVA